jgi:hypothetical protein
MGLRHTFLMANCIKAINSTTKVIFANENKDPFKAAFYAGLVGASLYFIYSFFK